MLAKASEKLEAIMQQINSKQFDIEQQKIFGTLTILICSDNQKSGTSNGNNQTNHQESLKIEPIE